MALNDTDFQKRLLATFQVEAQEYLNDLSRGLIELERNLPAAERGDLIENIFRQAHSLKGAARSVGAADLAAVCQSLESVFAQFKTRQLAPTPELLDKLHQALGSLQAMLSAESLLKPEPERAGRMTEELARYFALAPSAASGPAASPATPSVAAPRESATAAPEPQHDHGFNVPEDTVRISTARLNAVLLQAEEMLGARLSAAQRVTELQKITDEFAGWRKHWSALERAVRALELAQGRKSASGALPAPRDRSVQMADFLRWNAEFIRRIEGDLLRAGNAAAQGQRTLETLLNALLETAKDALMLPFSSVLEVAPALVRDLARRQHKEVELRIEGGEVEIDRRILEELKPVLIHLIGNAVDHGIEAPAKRREARKPESGLLTISVSHQTGNQIQVRVTDDGGGMSVMEIKAAATAAGLRNPAELAQLSDTEALRLVFESGVSTAPRLTEVSGRGLGLAIAREKIERLGGSIVLRTNPGEGTTFELLLPSTRARFRGVLVGAAGNRFIVPSAAIQRVGRVPPGALQPVGGQATVRLDGQTVPLLRLAQVLDLRGSRSGTEPRMLTFFVLADGAARVALVVDEIHGEEEILMKTLGPPLKRVRHLAGAAVLGDGRAAPILQVKDLLESACRSPSQPGGSPNKQEPAPKVILLAEDSITSRMLLKNILQSAGYKVDTAVDGQDAWTALKQKHFDALVSDVDMPRLSGFDLTARVRQDKALAHLPVLLVTALGSRAHKERGLEAGANAYVVKSSFDQSNLLEVLGQLLQQA